MEAVVYSGNECKTDEQRNVEGGNAESIILNIPFKGSSPPWRGEYRKLKLLDTGVGS
jgi:hypothetical protein